jgi:hypothetical protein
MTAGIRTGIPSEYGNFSGLLLPWLYLGSKRRPLYSFQIRRGDEALGVPYEYLIPGIARELMLMIPYQRPKTLPPILPPKEALRKLAQSAGRTIKVLDGLPEDALAALNYRPGALRTLHIQLRILHAAAKEAKVETRRSPPTKPQARKIARVVAQHYSRLTGKEPTVPAKDGKAYGPLLKLLQAVYRILDIKASAESQARYLIQEHRTADISAEPI